MMFKKYLTGTILALLLIWGPVDHSWPNLLFVRIGYLIALPLIIYLLIGWIWKLCQPSDKIEDALNRILSVIICAGLFVLAFLEATSTTHFVNTETIRTRDGYEDVGDYIAVPGPDYANAIIIALVGVMFFWLGVLRKGSKTT
jgi:hypothetical protein